MKWGLPTKGAIAESLLQMRHGIGAIVALSACVNILTITGSLYLMLVYDRVLPSQSLATLAAVFLMVMIAYVFYGLFDAMRSRMLADVASSLDRSLGPRVQEIVARLALERPDLREQVDPLRDLDQIRGYISSAGPPALIDLPWTVFFLIILTLVHYWLGLVTLIAMIGLAWLALHAERVSKQHLDTVTRSSARRRSMSEQQWRHAETISALGMGSRLRRQWRDVHHAFLDEQATLTDSSTTLSGISRVARMVVQSVVLTVGAILVIDGKATAGVIFASSILSGRALAPVDAAIATWKNFVGARQSRTRLDKLLAQVPVNPAERVELPRPAKTLAVSQLTLAAPGTTTAIVNGVNLTVEAGQAVGVIGPSASGKSSLMRGILGVWKASRGDVRLDGAAIQQWEADEFGQFVGYLPQSVELFAGTVAENIARFEPDAPSDAVIAAAQAAGVHELIVHLPGGYDTPISEDGLSLSAGQRQRIGLARALYRDPFLVVLDEPNSNLDADGEAALAKSLEGIKARGGIVVIVAHRREILRIVDLLLVMQNGQARAFGPRDEVLAQIDPAAAAAAAAQKSAQAQTQAPKPTFGRITGLPGRTSTGKSA